MKHILVLSLMVILSHNCFADNLLGRIKSQKSEIYNVIYDFQAKNSVSFCIRLDGSSDIKYRSTCFYLPIKAYYELFNSTKTIYGGHQDINFNIEYSANGELSNRTISLRAKTVDDEGNLAQTELIQIKLLGNKAIASVESFRKKWYSSSLKSVSKTLVKDLDVIREGVELFSDNQSWPLGRVITYEGLITAAKDTSTWALKRACEAECEEL